MYDIQECEHIQNQCSMAQTHDTCTDLHHNSTHWHGLGVLTLPFQLWCPMLLIGLCYDLRASAMGDEENAYVHSAPTVLCKQQNKLNHAIIRYIKHMYKVYK